MLAWDSKAKILRETSSCERALDMKFSTRAKEMASSRTWPLSAYTDPACYPYNKAEAESRGRRRERLTTLVVYGLVISTLRETCRDFFMWFPGDLRRLCVPRASVSLTLFANLDTSIGQFQNVFSCIFAAVGGLN